MAEHDLRRRREELTARRAGLSSTQQALLAQRMKGATGTSSGERVTAYLVPFQTGRAAYRPLFLIPPINGQASCYVELVRYLDPDQPCYGIRAPDPTVGAATQTSIETLAARYVQLIRDIQVEGPYLLGGWSFGGGVAFEMAQQLHAQNQAVAMLALIDSQFTTDKSRAQADDEAAEMIGFALALGLPPKFGDSTQLTLEQQYAQALEYLRDLTREERLAYVLAQIRQARMATASFGPEQIRLAFQAYQVNARAMKQYEPRPYRGVISSFQASERFSPELVNPISGWEDIATGGLHLYVVPGNHYTMLREPNVKNLAEQLKQQLRPAEKT